MHIIGLDIGTTTISAVVLDSKTGLTKASRTISNGADLAPDITGGKLQDPDVIISKLQSVLQELKSQFSPIAAIGIDGQMHGMLYVNTEGEAVSPLYTWQDNRGNLPLGEGSYVSEMKRISGCEMSTGFGLATHFWMTQNNKIPASAVKLCSIFDYAAMRLTGRKSPLMHSSGAASFGMFDLYHRCWMINAVSACGMDISYLPEIVFDCALAGKTSDGIPVSCGIGDNQSSFIGSVRNLDNSVLVNIGTGGQISMKGFLYQPVEDLEMRPLVDDAYIVAGSMLCGGRAYALLESFVRSVCTLTGYKGDKLYQAMNAIANEALDLENPWRVDTRFSGTRRQPEIRGSIQGIGIDNFDIQHLIIGLLNGMVDETMELYTRIPHAGFGRPKELIGSGNGLRQNAALRKLYEKRFGLHMKIPRHSEEAAYGAALYGMVAAGLSASLSEAQQLIQYD